MTKPTIHLNGTSAADLLAQYRAAYEATFAALEALCKAAPHGRDYYLQGNSSYPGGSSAITNAQNEHEARVAKLLEVSEELHQLALHVYQGVK